MFNNSKLLRYLKDKYGIDIILEDIPNDFVHFEIYNPNNVNVQYISWFEHDLAKNEDEIINEIQQYKKK